MARVRARPRFAGRGRRPGGTWSRGIQASLTNVPAASKVLIDTFVLDNVSIAETVRRTLGHFIVTSDQDGADEQQLGAFGLVRISDAAGAIGITAMPGPVTERNDDGWFVWQSILSRGDASIAPAGQNQMYAFDSKGMRRIEEGFRIVVVVENSHATHGFDFGLGISLYSTRS